MSQPGPGSRMRAASTDRVYNLPSGVDPFGPCRYVLNRRGKLCREDGKLMLDAVATTAPPGLPVHDYRCPKHAFRP